MFDCLNIWSVDFVLPNLDRKTLRGKLVQSELMSGTLLPSEWTPGKLVLSELTPGSLVPVEQTPGKLVLSELTPGTLLPV
jgi:hypothetical protein